MRFRDLDFEFRRTLTLSSCFHHVFQLIPPLKCIAGEFLEITGSRYDKISSCSARFFPFRCVSFFGSPFADLDLCSRFLLCKIPPSPTHRAALEISGPRAPRPFVSTLKSPRQLYAFSHRLTRLITLSVLRSHLRQPSDYPLPQLSLATLLLLLLQFLSYLTTVFPPNRPSPPSSRTFLLTRTFPLQLLWYVLIYTFPAS